MEQKSIPRIEAAIYGKGGIDKPTISANLSAALAQRGERVKSGSYTAVLYDVLSDVVCGDFAVPIRREYANRHSRELSVCFKNFDAFIHFITKYRVY